MSPFVRACRSRSAEAPTSRPPGSASSSRVASGGRVHPSYAVGLSLPARSGGAPDCSAGHGGVLAPQWVPAPAPGASAAVGRPQGFVDSVTSDGMWPHVGRDKSASDLVDPACSTASADVMLAGPCRVRPATRVPRRRAERTGVIEVEVVSRGHGRRGQRRGGGAAGPACPTPGAATGTAIVRLRG